MWEATRPHVTPSTLLEHCRISTLRFPPQDNYSGGSANLFIYFMRRRHVQVPLEVRGRFGGRGSRLLPCGSWGRNSLWSSGLATSAFPHWAISRTQDKGVNQWLQGEIFLCWVCLMSPERQLFSSHPGPEWENWSVLKHQLHSTKPARIKTPVLNFSPCVSDEVAFAEYSAPCSSGEHLVTSLPLTSFPSKLLRTLLDELRPLPQYENTEAYTLGRAHCPWKTTLASLPKCAVAYGGKSDGPHSPPWPVCFPAENPTVSSQLELYLSMCCFFSPHIQRNKIFETHICGQDVAGVPKSRNLQDGDFCL